MKSFFSKLWAKLIVDAESRGFVVGLIAPLMVVLLMLKAWRIRDRAEWESIFLIPDLFRSELMVGLGLAALGLATMRAVGTPRLRCLILGCVQVIAVLVVAFDFVAHVFYALTASVFDLHLLIFSLGQMEDTFSVVGSIVPLRFWLFMGGIVAALLFLPWFIRSQSDEVIASAGVDEAGSGRAWKLALVGAMALLMAIPTSPGEYYSAFGRASVVNMGFSLYQMSGREQLTGDRSGLTELRAQRGEEADEPLQNVAIIILESTRARSTTLDDPQLLTTPYLAELAERSLVAERAYAVVPHTSKALVATLCGLEPRLHMPISESLPGGLPPRCLPKLLADVGYESAFFQSATEFFENRRGLVANMGFDHFEAIGTMERQGFEEANYFGFEDMIMMPSSRAWLEERRETPFLATYLTVTPHHEYLAPQRFGIFDFAEDDELNRYLNSIYYVDQFSRELLEQYRELGLYENTLFIFIGDHGQAFGEHGRLQHDNVIWEEGLHVPLMIYDPRSPRRQRISTPVTQIDLVPTLIDWLGLDVLGDEMPGYVFGQAPPERQVMAHCWYEARCMASIGERYKFIDHFERRPPEVYDLLEDPLELDNLYDEMREESQSRQAEMRRWRAEVNTIYRRGL